ncbi:ATP-binding protein [Amycolatopsis nigrescens]|uniref:ATP-binding protein n=1 Tax=Amycolatopsis nigrescens TaxID=381445 RepID=UPI001469BD1C|nr:tetratricopeptide repeat protein [Amycolatopsis nigrescens]
MAGTPEVQNLVSGPAVGNVVQAGQIDTVTVDQAGRPPGVPRQLPAASHLFTGREAELELLTAALDAELEQGSTVVISALGGAGGMGKTWLALHWAHQHQDRFPDGQLFVDLRGFDRSENPMPPHEAVRGFLDALGVAADDMPVELSAQAGLYRSLLAKRRMLIVLDNARDSDQVTPLLPGAPGCTVVITSRNRMAGLVTTQSARPVAVEALDERESRALLSRRLGAERLEAEPAAATELVQWCAGLPLALSIVAGRAVLDPQIPLADLAAELRSTSSRLSALDEGTSTACLETVLSWSYRSLTDPQAAVFVLLGLAPGPDISLSAAASLTGLPEREVFAVLRSLERVSLVQQHTSKRYRMHDLVRLYAAKQAQAADWDHGLRRLVTFACHTSHAADLLIAPNHAPIDLDELVNGCVPQQLATSDEGWAWLATERANLMATLQLARQMCWYSAVWQLAWAMTTFNLRQGHLHENLAAWKAGLAAAQHLPDPRIRTRSYRHRGRAHAQLGEHDDALRHLQAGLAWAHEHGDRLGEAHTHRAVAVAWGERGEYRNALDHSEQAFHLYEQLDVSVSGAHALNEIGWYTAKLGNLEQARQHCIQALEHCRNEDDRSGEAMALRSIGYIAHLAGDSEHAVRNYEQSRSLCQDLGDAATEASVLDHLGDAIETADAAAAQEVWQKALDLYRSQRRAEDVHRVQQKLTTLG